MKGYIEKVWLKYRYAKLTHPQLTLHKYREVKYNSKQQLIPEDDTIPDLDAAGVKWTQEIIGAILYYACAIENRLSSDISAIGSQQTYFTEDTTAAIKQLLYYVATYPNDGIVYRGSDMVLAAHYDVLFHNKSKSRIRAGDHKCLSENYPDPRWNVPVLTIA